MTWPSLTLSKTLGVLGTLLLLALTAATSDADVRTSTSYTIPADTVDAGGQHATSVTYTHHGSVGGIAGISTVASPAEAAKAGYIGQLNEVTGLQISASPTTVDEGATRQLNAAQVLDDDTIINLGPDSVTWNVMAGPFTGITSGGVATAGQVHENTVATAQGSFAGDIGQLDLTVNNITDDDFGIYAEDGLPDDWQVQYFGEDNAEAGPNVDADGDGDSNLYEYHARLLPNDPASFLSITLTPDATEGDALLTLSPGKAGVNYAVSTKDSLLDADWIPLTAIVGSEGILDFTDVAASGLRKFYIVTPTRTP